MSTTTKKPSSQRRRSKCNPKPVLIPDRGDPVYEIQALIAEGYDYELRRWVYRARWKGYDSSDDTWQLTEELHSCPDVMEKFKIKFGRSPRSDGIPPEEIPDLGFSNYERLNYPHNLPPIRSTQAVPRRGILKKKAGSPRPTQKRRRSKTCARSQSSDKLPKLQPPPKPQIERTGFECTALDDERRRVTRSGGFITPSTVRRLDVKNKVVDPDAPPKRYTIRESGNGRKRSRTRSSTRGSTRPKRRPQRIVSALEDERQQGSRNGRFVEEQPLEYYPAEEDDGYEDRPFTLPMEFDHEPGYEVHNFGSRMTDHADDEEPAHGSSISLLGRYNNSEMFINNPPTDNAAQQYDDEHPEDYEDHDHPQSRRYFLFSEYTEHHHLIPVPPEPRSRSRVVFSPMADDPPPTFDVSNSGSEELNAEAEAEVVEDVPMKVEPYDSSLDDFDISGPSFASYFQQQPPLVEVRVKDESSEIMDDPE